MAEYVYLTMTANDESWGTTNPAYGAHKYLSPGVETLQAFPGAGYYFVEWDGPVDDPLANPTTITFLVNVTVTAVFGEDLELNTGSSYSQSRLRDVASPLLQPHEEALSSGFGDVANVGFAYWSPAQLLRGPQVPASYYDHDGNPATEEMLMYDYTAGFLENIGTDLFVGGGHGTIGAWNQKTLAQKLLWIQEYEP